MVDNIGIIVKLDNTIRYTYIDFLGFLFVFRIIKHRSTVYRAERWTATSLVHAQIHIP